MADKLTHIGVTINRVASENEIYKPAKSGLCSLGRTAVNAA